MGEYVLHVKEIMTFDGSNMNKNRNEVWMK